MTDHAKYLERQSRYNQSEKGRARHYRYDRSEKGQARRERSYGRERAGLVQSSTERSRNVANRRDQEAIERLLAKNPWLGKALAEAGLTNPA